MSSATKIIIALLVLVLIGVAVVGLSDDEEPAATNNTNNQDAVDNTPNNDGQDADSNVEDDAEAVATTSVSIVDSSNDGFSPATIRVRQNAKVTWTNNDSLPHTVKFADEESDRLSQGDTFDKTFNTTGTFSYVCGLHSNMTGTVIVEE